jgi:hypothetical protein
MKKSIKEMTAILAGNGFHYDLTGKTAAQKRAILQDRIEKHGLGQQSRRAFWQK